MTYFSPVLIFFRCEILAEMIRISVDSDPKLDPPGYVPVVYPERWVMLLLFCMLEGANALLWISFAPISDKVQHYFGNGVFGSVTAVNMLANVFLIFYGPGTVLAATSMKIYGLRNSLIIGGTVTMFGALMRVFAAIYHQELGNESTYYLMLLGQTLGSLAQPVFLNMPSVIASTWFPVTERDIATTIGAVSSPIANAIGSVLPVLFVHQTTTTAADGEVTYTVHGMTDSMLCQFVMCLVPLLFAVGYFVDAPPTPPSMSTLLQSEGEERGHDCVKETSTPWEKGMEELRILFADRNYLLLMVFFSLNQGFFCAIMTLVNEMIMPHGYSNADSGVFGAVFISCGVVGAAVFGSLMKKYRNYRVIMKVTSAMAFLMTIWFLCMIYRDNYWPLLLSYGSVGFFMLPLVPISMTNCAECTYPVSEELAMGLLLVGANVAGFGLIFVLQSIMEMAPLGPSPVESWLNLFFVGVYFIQNIILLNFNGQYKRLQKEQEHSLGFRQCDAHTPLLLPGE